MLGQLANIHHGQQANMLYHMKGKAKGKAKARKGKERKERDLQ